MSINKQSFSSFSDLKDLQHQLRKKEAEIAQAKADAIEISPNKAHTNSLKKEAVRAKERADSLGRELEAERQKERDSSSRGHGSNVSSGNGRSESRASGASRHGERNSRGESRGDGRRHQDRNAKRDDARPESAKERRERQDDDARRLDRALNRLQKHADAKRAESFGKGGAADALKGDAKRDNERNGRKNRCDGEGNASRRDGERNAQRQDGKSRSEQMRERNEKRERRNAHDRSDRSDRSDRNERKNKRQGRNGAPLLQGKYFDSELLSKIRPKLDDVSYQSRRTAYNKLSDLDNLILKVLAELKADAEYAAKAEAKASAPVAEAKAEAQTEAQASAVAESAAKAASTDGVAPAANAEGVAPVQPEAVQQTPMEAPAATAAGTVVDVKELLKTALLDDKVAALREEIELFVEEAYEKLKYRKENLPPLEYPENLPVSQRHDEIVDLIKNNQVVIIAGETGSGKTTQIPKMCLEAGLGIKGLIGHTQPRRLAARAVAARIAEEMKEELGKSVSYKVRFTDISSEDSFIKLMTDGILLTELASDRMLLNYDVIIIDEAHERSLNIDFLLGYLRNLLKKRQDLKLIITSATIDVERFSQHFDNAPIIEVSGRTYPVEVVYMPLMDDAKGIYIESHDGEGRFESHRRSESHTVDETDAGMMGDGPGQWHNYQGGSKSVQAAAAASRRSQNNNDDDDDIADTLDLRQGILEAIKYLQRRGPGDTLVFLPGERDILEISQFLRRAGLRDTEIVPLYARLATNEQNKIFTAHTGVRIVLSTNVAETSLTVPGIRYVIDPGLARISRYSSRTKVQRLPIERISQASANQRKGRCGRVSDGICVRLYSKDDFDNRPEFTDPEILRTNLASVLLQMASLRLGKIENFPFIDAPQPRQVSDGLRLLDELGATYLKGRHKGEAGDEAGNGGESRGGREGVVGDLELTKVGRALSRLPCDPRLARMIVEAEKYHCLNEVLIITSALAVMDPREYPIDKKEAATQQHARFKDEKSDFLSFIKLYDYINELKGSLSASALRRRLKQEFISFLRVREWMDVHRQLRVSAQSMEFKLNTEPADYESIHRALVSGLLSHLGMIEPNGNNYVGARGSKFVIFPGSFLSKKPPKWICAAELAETSRLFARTVATIDPSYAENAASHLIKNAYHEPHWSKKNGAVMAYLTRSIYGLPIVQRRLVQYQEVDPKICHELMIRDGFVEGNIECNHKFFRNNLSMIDDVEYLEDKMRRRDLLVDSSTLEAFYHERIPSHITNMRDFDKWWKQKSKEDPNFLDFSYELISKNDLMSLEENAYPEYWNQGSLKFKLSYVFDIGSDRDGVTVHIPITVINQVRHEDFLWQIDGLREELFSSLIRSLPKRLRRNLIPAPEYAKALSESLRVYIDLIHQGGSAPAGAGASDANGAGSSSAGGAGGAGGNAFGAKKKVTKVENLFVAVAKELTRMGGELITIEDFDRSQIEPYLFVNFSIEGVNGQELGFGKDFTALSSRMQGQARDALHEVVKSHRISAPAQSWEYGTIKREQISKQGSLRVTAYPALTDRGEGVTLELYDNVERQEKAMRQGAIKLLALSLKTPTAYLETHLPNRAKLSMYYQPLGSIKELIMDLTVCAIGNIMDRNGGVPWDEESFNKLHEKVRGELNDEALELAKIVEQSLYKAHELKRLLKGSISFDLARSYSDLNKQLDGLIYKGFISECGTEHLKELPRYLEAALIRVERLHRDVVRDQMYMRTIDGLQEDYDKLLKSYHADLIPPPLKDVRWMIEELRVSYYAQNLGVIGPISDKRITNELNRIQKEWPPHK